MSNKKDIRLTYEYTLRDALEIYYALEFRYKDGRDFTIYFDNDWNRIICDSGRTIIYSKYKNEDDLIDNGKVFGIPLIEAIKDSKLLSMG